MKKMKCDVCKGTGYRMTSERYGYVKEPVPGDCEECKGKKYIMVYESPEEMFKDMWIEGQRQHSVIKEEQ